MSRLLCRILGHQDELEERHLGGADPVVRVFPRCRRCGRYGWGFVKKLRILCEELDFRTGVEK